MSRLLREPQKDEASLTLLIALQRGQRGQVIALRRIQGMAKVREEDISKREGDLPLLPQAHHLLTIFKS